MLAFCCLGWRGDDYRKIANNTFHRGEFLKFRIHYGLITAGYATLEVKEERKVVQGRNCYHIVGEGFTNQAFDVFYKVRDYYETFMDEEAMISLRFNRLIREGGFENYSETHFDQQNRKALYIDHKKRRTTYEVPENIQDVISAFYFARTRYNQDSLQPGDRISLQNFLDRKNFGLEASLICREKIKIDGQWYNALKMNLLIEEAGLVTDGSTIVFWISDDNNKIPLRIQSELVIGSLKADLIEYQNLHNPFSSKL
ncbi:MAG: DUF3108 domain-containing protein [Bacteroidia bacterium]